jgi:hypothetical protein
MLVRHQSQRANFTFALHQSSLRVMNLNDLEDNILVIVDSIEFGNKKRVASNCVRKPDVMHLNYGILTGQAMPVTPGKR